MMLSCLHAYSVIPPPKKPTGLRSSLSGPESLHSCILSLRVIWANFEQIVVGLPVELCNLSANANLLYAFLFVWPYIITIKKEIMETSCFCETALLLGHAQLRCTYFGRSRVK